MIFSDSPQQRALERMMTAVPRFRPKGGGIMVLHHFEYTAEMCDCRYCPYYRGKRKCTASQCPCIEERIVAGAASRAEVMAETMARRCGKRKVKQVGTKTEQGRYSSKYALTELLICGECGTPYRRCTWAANGKKKVVWRCINRLDYGKKYCHDSPSIEESVLQEAIMKAVLQTAKQNADVLKTLKLHIGMGLSAETTEDNSLDLQIRIAEVEAEFQKMLKAIAADNVEAFDEEKAKALMDEKAKLQIQLDRIADTKQKRENAKSRLDEIFTIIEALANHPISYDDQIVRQVLESVIVESKEKIKVVFVGGLEVTQLM